MNKLEPVTINFEIFEPYIKEKQTKVHYNGHYLKYINNFNKSFEIEEDLIKIYSKLKEKNNNTLKNSLLLAIVESYDSNSDIVHNAAQIYNHELYWKTIIKPDLSKTILLSLKNKLFESEKHYNLFYDNFITLGTKHFGSGWLWIILNNNKLDVITTHDAIIPYKEKILGVIDIWEHSYYLDYESDRKKYLENMFKMVNWKRIYKKLYTQ
jgi:Fe-Mn family superoxide dismutase